jgi:predicted HicB family RNase H-like nuclease
VARIACALMARSGVVHCHPMSNKSDQLSVRIDPLIRERLELAAERDRRPVSNLVRNVLADWLDQSHRGRQLQEH